MAVQRTSGPPRHGRAPLGALLAIALAALLSLPAGAAAEIVYTHGQPQPQLPVGGGYTPSTLVAMGDGGSDQHVLLNPSQVASDQLSLCCASLQPDSSTMVFNGFDFQYSGSSAGGPWGWAGGTLGSPPDSFAADLANPQLLAYTNYEPAAHGNELLIGNQSASTTTVVAVQPDVDVSSAPAWNPSGTELVDVTDTPRQDASADGSAGLWVFAASAGASARELLVEPNPSTTEFASSPTFSNPVFVGASEIAFQADNNIWEIPASCNQCAFPAGAKQLTTDGTSSVPDTNPAWTSETVTAPGGSMPPPAAAKLKLTLRVAAAQKVVAQKGLGATVECNVACAIAVVGGVQLQGARKALLTATVSETLAAGARTKVILSLTRSALRTIKAALAHHKRISAAVAVAAKDSTGQKASATSTFRIEH